MRFHLDLATLDTHRDELEAGRIVLTHMGPEMLARVGDVGYMSAVDGLTLTV